MGKLADLMRLILFDSFPVFGHAAPVEEDLLYHFSLADLFIYLFALYIPASIYLLKLNSR